MRLSSGFVAVIAAALASITFSVGAEHSQGGGCTGIDYSDEAVSVAGLFKLYQDERFGDLDAVLTCLSRDTRSFKSGKPASAAVYRMFRRLNGDSVSAAEIERVKRWSVAAAQPSVFAEFAALRLRYAFSWKARGGASFSNTPNEQMRAFRDGMSGAEAALYRATAELRNTPMWHQLLLAVAGDLPASQTNMMSIFQDGVKRWPTNYDFHEVVLTRLVPRWGGSWEKVDAFITHHAALLAGSEQDAMYARLYAAVLLAIGDDPKATRIDWNRMKRGLEALVKLYPDPHHANIAASFACYYGDASYRKLTFDRLYSHKEDVFEIRGDSWLRVTDPQAC